MNKWNKVVTTAWLRRKYGEESHPPKADRIYRRFAANICRVEAWAEQDPRRIAFDGKNFRIVEV